MRSFIWLSLVVVIFWVVIFISGMGLFSYAFGNVPASSAGFQLPDFKIYHSKKMGIEFNYPERYGLKVREKDGIITIEHSVKFDHPNPCDGSGLPAYQNSKKITDFYVEITVLFLTPTELFLQEVLQVNEAGVIVEPRSTLRVTYGGLDGFRVYNGNHGCGPYSYFFQLTDEKVLRVDRYPASEFREVPEEEKQMYSRLRQIILPENEEHIFRGILSSVKVESR